MREKNHNMEVTQRSPSSTYMEHMKGSPSSENDASNMKEFLRALGDIQNIDLDKLRAQFLQNVDQRFNVQVNMSSKAVNENVGDDLVYKTNHNLEDLKRETDRVRKCLKEEQNFRKEYAVVFGERKIHDLHKMMEDLNGANEKLQEETERLKKLNRNLEEERRKALEAKSDALTRLSKQMGDQMTNNNPNIADLSDQNRPNKLGERYTELYDNQWTNAFEVLTETHRQQDERAIEILLNLLYECHSFAKTTAKKQMDDLLTLVSGDSQMQVGDEIKCNLKKARKLVDVKRADLLFEKCEQHVWDKAESSGLYLYEEDMKQYLVECFQICWLMAIQDPPVVLGKEVKYADSFDTNLYKHYTRSGTNLNFVVWPPLLLHEHGPLLAKGVAQPIQEKRDEITIWKIKKYMNAWDDEDTNERRNRPVGSTKKHDSPITTTTVINDWQISTHRPQITTSAPSYLVTRSNMYPLTTVNQNLKTDHSRNTGTSYRIDSVSPSYKQNNDRVDRGLHPTISSTLGTRHKYATESENKSTLFQRDSLLYTGGVNQNDARNLKNKSTQSREVVSPYTCSTRPNYAGDMVSKLHNSAARIKNATRGRRKLTRQRVGPKHFCATDTSHGYEPLKKHEQNVFIRFVDMYNRKGEPVTRKHFKAKYNRYRALQLELDQ